MDKVRVDKWLWAVRIFKSRTLAGDVVRAGKVRVNGKIVKPSFGLAVGDTLTVQKNGFTLSYDCLRLIDKRVGAPIAITCYEDKTPAEEKTKYKDWFIGKSGGEFREKGTGRPTKRERRDINKYKETEDYFEEGDEF